MDARDSGNLGRIANAVEKIAHTLEKPKNTSEFRIAALKRISNAVVYITNRMEEGVDENEYRILEHIRIILLKEN